MTKNSKDVTGKPPMGMNAIDLAAKLARGAVGSIPLVGTLAVEVVGSIIPNQRIDRIEAFIRKLDAKLEGFDIDQIRERVKASSELIDLIEDGFIQASRALTDERKEHIASLIKNGLTDQERNYSEYKRMFSLLSQLNDIQLIMLLGHSNHRTEQETDFWQTHKDILLPPRLFDSSPQETRDKHDLFYANKSHLVQLGLLIPIFKKPMKGEVPEFDPKTGKLISNGFYLTNLGHMLLKSIDQETPE